MDDATLPLCEPTAISGTAPDAPASELPGTGPRYEPLEVIGAGGMGEVRLVRDRHLERDVAVKVIREHHAGRGDVEARFLAEARIQGRLEHPAIVPVYDLGHTELGAPYFTMKRIRGRALDELLEAERRGEDTGWSRRKLLTAFGSVCLAIDFAHERGVLHRDLKPANIMLGDFGEVYVLDWGIAKLTGEAAQPEVTTQTIDGGIMGTPGYMSPEQLQQTSDQLTPASDIYALGAILFELLTLEPLHARGSVSDLIRATIAGADTRVSVRAPKRDVPPELEAICRRATALDPAQRYARARELSDAVERFLDGDRDLEMRRAAAEQHLTLADEAIVRAEAPDSGDEHAERATAMRELTRAIALDPGNDGAIERMVKLMLEPPRTLPAEAHEEMERVRGEARVLTAKLGSRITSAFFLVIPLVAWMGVREMVWAYVAIACLLVMITTSLLAGRMGKTSWIRRDIVFACGIGLVVVVGQQFGPLIVAPGLAAGILLPMVINARPAERFPMLAISIAALLVPLGLELAGALAPSYTFAGGAMHVNPRMVALPEVPTLIVLSLWAVAQVASPVFFGLRLHEKFTSAEERLHLNAWYLRQLAAR